MLLFYCCDPPYFGVQYSIVNALIITFMFLPALVFQQIDVGVELFDDYTVGEFDVSFDADVPRDDMFEALVLNTRTADGADRTLKEIEIWEDDGDSWLVRHRYGVSFLVITDWTDMALRFTRTPGANYDELSWELEESLDGKILRNDGYYRVYDGGDGRCIVRYWSRTEYASRRPGVAFSLENFASGILKATFTRMVDSAR
jgi:hypothetical protein